MKPSATQRPWPWQARQGYPWDGIQVFTGRDPLETDGGAPLWPWQLVYEEWGPPGGEPVVVFHALTGFSHAAARSTAEPAGWWQRVVGPGLGLDTNRYHILCFNVLGGAMGSTGPSSLDAEGRPWGSRFPRLTLFDIARGANQLIEHWTDRPVKIVGGSMGGMLAYAYAALFPGMVAGIFTIGAPIRHEPWAIAYHTVGRAAIVNDPHFQGGDYYGGPYPDTGLATARMADMISYQHPESMGLKFGRRRQPPHFDDFEVTSYLGYQGQKLVNRYDANSYLVLTRAMDEFGLTSQQMRDLARTPVWMLGMESDLLYLPQEISEHARILEAHGVSVELKWLSGPWGHDTFLVDQEQAGQAAAAFLAAMAT
jgi:homoserine O-acetyltransferase